MDIGGGGDEPLLFRLEEEAVDESPSSVVSTGDRGAMMDDSERDFRDDFSSTLIVSVEWTVNVLPVERRGRDWLCTICIPKGEIGE